MLSLVYLLEHTLLQQRHTSLKTVRSFTKITIYIQILKRYTKMRPSILPMNTKAIYRCGIKIESQKYKHTYKITNKLKVKRGLQSMN